MTEQATPSRTNGGGVPALVKEQRLRTLEPMSLLEDVQADLSRLFEVGPFGGWPFARSWQRRGQLPAARAPRVDVFERAGDIVIKAELPGVKKEDVDLSIEGDDLVLRAEQREEREVKDENWYRMERSYGSLYRRLPLPEGTKVEAVKAALSDGVLEITVPKATEQVPQRQKIAIGEPKEAQ
jgi:HSP20 family protein